MSTEIKKTMTFAALALLLVATAYFTTRPRKITAEAFNDQGQSFFPDFKDPRDATTLEVIGYDAESASAIPFKVTLDPKKGWVIPSHHDYPADAKDRLARTASGVMDLKKDVIVSDQADQFEALEVIDPLDTKTTTLKGRGQRVTLKDNSGKTLADFIVGKSVPGRENQRYLRVPDQKVTYAVNLPADFTLSTKFGDWIETNLLKLSASDIVEVAIDNHKVDPEMGTVEPGDKLALKRKDSAAAWTLDEVPPEREVDTSKTSTLSSALADLKIVGVRTKPEGLSTELKAEARGEGEVKLSNDSVRSLASRGFYLTRDGRLLSNQGDVIVSTSPGLIYTLRFGEVTFASGDELTAGSETESAKEESAKADQAKDQGQSTSTESRFLFVTAQFDPNLIPKPEAPPQDGELPAESFQRTPEEVKQAQDELKRKEEEYQKKIEDGKKKAQELSERFAPWYYVVPGDAFRSIVLDRAGMTRPKNASATTSDAPPGLSGPSMFPPGGAFTPPQP